MKILHLYSDWKWTGPAEPVLQMCRSLLDRGHEVLLAHSPDAFEEPESVRKKVVEYGIPATEQFSLDRHVPLRNTFRDLRSLPGFISGGGFDVVHMHLSHDHAFGALCAKLSRGPRPLLVRTLHRRSVLKDSLLNRFLLRRLTDAALTFTPGFRDETVRRFGLDPDRVGVQPMTIDLERFRPDAPYRDMRPELGIPAEATVIGIVGRFQKYRKMDVFLEAAKEVLRHEPETRFVVIGRSSQIRDTVIAPMERLGITDRVIMAGYRTGDYADVLACLDVFTLLMPGFDGTARAVREAMALAKPCVVSDYGMLPEIVPHGTAGLNSPIEPQALAANWLRMVREPDTRRAWGRQAREHAEKHFRIDSVGPCLEQFYERLAGAPRHARDGRTG